MWLSIQGNFTMFTSLNYEVSRSYKFGEDMHSALREDPKQYSNRKISFVTSVRKMKGTFTMLEVTDKGFSALTFYPCS